MPPGVVDEHAPGRPAFRRPRGPLAGVPRDVVPVRMGHTVGTARDHADDAYDAVFGAILAAVGGA